MTTPTEDDPLLETLRSFAVMARFRRVAESPEQAEAVVRGELAAVPGMFDDTRVEPQEPDGSWAVDVRFVVASVDNQRAVEGVHDALRTAGLVPDEAWLADELA